MESFVPWDISPQITSFTSQVELRSADLRCAQAKKLWSSSASQNVPGLNQTWWQPHCRTVRTGLVCSGIRRKVKAEFLFIIHQYSKSRRKKLAFHGYWKGKSSSLARQAVAHSPLKCRGGLQKALIIMLCVFTCSPCKHFHSLILICNYVKENLHRSNILPISWMLWPRQVPDFREQNLICLSVLRLL